MSGTVTACMASPLLRRCSVRGCDLTMRARVEGQLAAWRNCVVFHRMTPAIRSGIAMIISPTTISIGSKSGANAIARPPAVAAQNCFGRRSGPPWMRNRPSRISTRPRSPATAAPMRSTSPRNSVLLSATGVVRRRISAGSVPSPSREKAACIASLISVACALAAALDGARTLRRVWRTFVWFGSGSRSASTSGSIRRRALSKARVTRASSRSVVVASSTVAMTLAAVQDGTRSRASQTSHAARSSAIPTPMRLVAPIGRVSSPDPMLLGLVGRVEHDARDLALGLVLVVGIWRPEFERLLPEFGALRAGGGAGPRLHLFGADLHFDLGVGEEVAVPAGMLRRAALRGDDDIAAVAGVTVEQRKDELLAGF